MAQKYNYFLESLQENKNWTESSIIQKIKDWLRHAPQRFVAENNRSNLNATSNAENDYLLESDEEQLEDHEEQSDEVENNVPKSNENGSNLENSNETVDEDID